MKIDAAKSGNILIVLLTVYNPTTDTAVDPTSAQAQFFSITAGGLVPATAIPTTALAQQGGVTGVWGCVVDVSGVTLATLVVVVTAVVGGVTRSVLKVFGDQVTQVGLSIGAPQITVTSGLVVDEAKNPAS